MLRKYKNGFLELIQKNDFEPKYFKIVEEIQQGYDYFTLRLLDTPLLFEVRSTDGERHLFEFRYTQFLMGNPSTSFMPAHLVNIDYVYSDFETWLKAHVQDYLDNLQTPDLWEQIKLQKSLISTSSLEEQDTSNFAEEEKEQLRLALSKFRLLIEEAFTPTQEQLQIIDARINYVSEALDRLNRFDWRSTLLTTTLSISITLTLDTARGRLLFDLLKRVLSNIWYLGQ